MSTHDQDKLEQELDELQRQYRAAARDEPPTLLDQAVLNRARRAAERHAIRPWSFSWMHATATAALVVLGLAVVMQVRDASGPPEAPAALSKEPRLDYQDEQDGPDRAVDALKAFRQREAEALEDQQNAQKSELLRELREEAIRPAAPAPAAEPPVLIFRPVPAGWQRHTKADSSIAAAARVDEAASAEAVGQSQQRAAAPAGQEADADVLEFSGETRVLASAEEWLTWIIELKQAGLERAWRSELEAFGEVFPDHAVPEELLATELEDPGPAPQDP
jgi:hypothetical protein